MAFALESFLPYLLNQAAEAISKDFQKNYRGRYGMLRTEWRVLFHLGVYGQMTAKEICEKASIHKTKISRAVAALEHKKYLTKSTKPEDRRIEKLMLTALGKTVFRELHESAEKYEGELAERFDDQEFDQLIFLLQKLKRFDNQLSDAAQKHTD